MLNIKLDKWQEEILKAEGNICLRSGRQVGKSTIISILAGNYAANNGCKTIMIVAAVERQAYLLFEKVLFYMEQAYPKLIKKKKDKPTKSRIRLINGSVIYCLPTGITGYGIRGFTIDLLIADEAAFIPDAVFSAITPSIATRVKQGARIVLLSTPFGRKGYFAKTFNDPTFTNFHISSEECERISRDFLRAEKERMTKRQYAQEYLGEFVDELMQFFPDNLIISRMTLKRKELIRGKQYYLGVDLARMGEDESTFEVFELMPNRFLEQIENQVTVRTLLYESTNHIIELDKLYNFQKILIDDEGIGVGVYDYLLQEEAVKRKIIPINNSKRVLDKDGIKSTRLLKEDLYNNLLMLMESGKIQLLDDPEIFHSLKSVQYEYTSDSLGRPHLHIFGSYTHICEGIIRGAWCSACKPLNVWINSIKI
jgi:hypothetical protein